MCVCFLFYGAFRHRLDFSKFYFAYPCKFLFTVLHYFSWSVQMENRIDFVNWLDPDMSIQILTCLDDLSDLLRVTCVSRCWRQYGKRKYSAMSMLSSVFVPTSWL